VLDYILFIFIIVYSLCVVFLWTVLLVIDKHNRMT